MAQEPAAQMADADHCPWCSAELPSPSEAIEECPSCGAKLHGETESALPGVTAIDAEAIVRGARAPTGQRRSRLLSWISGEDAEPAEAPAPPGSLAPPPPDVRREILRLELQAEVANLQAEADSMLADEQAQADENAPSSEGAAPEVAAEATANADDSREPPVAS
jgi:hypothetical protein